MLSKSLCGPQPGAVLAALRRGKTPGPPMLCRWIRLLSRQTMFNEEY